jgi:hypothetical protein
MTSLVKMVNAFKSTETFNQVGQSKMTFFVKMDNYVMIKLDILCYLIGKDNYKLG